MKFMLYATLPVIVLLIGLIIRMSEIPRPLWSDEYITLQTLKEDPLTNPFYQGLTTNLPLYFWCLKLVSFLAREDVVVVFRSFGVVVNLLTGLLLYKHISRGYTFTIGLIFLIIFILSPLQIHYSAELRPYVLCQLLASVLFILISNGVKTNKKIVFINTAAILGLLCHYSFYIFFGAVVALLLYKRTNLKTLIKVCFLPALVACVIGTVYFANPLFKDSLVGSNLGRENSTFLFRLVQTENLSRIKEVISNYYYYGLYYYRIDPWAQFFLKKVFLVLFVTGACLAFKTRKTNTTLMGAFTILFLTLIISMTGEKAGYYPFGGRHIMPFSFLLYIVVAFSLVWASKFKYVGKLTVALVLSLILSSFIGFQACSQVFSQRYTGTNDPQGDIYTYCLGEVIR